MNERPGRAGGLGMLIGAVLVIVSGFLTWFTFRSGDAEEAVKGIGNETGALVMALGAVVFAFVVAILGLILAIRGRGRGLAIAGLILVLFPLIIGAYASFAPEGAIVAFESKQASENLGISESQAKEAIQASFDSGQLEATAAIGAYAALAGSVLAFVGSIAGIARGGRRPEAVVAPPAPEAYPPAAPPPPPPTAPPAP